MTVELINNNPNEILDLTGANETPTEEVLDTSELDTTELVVESTPTLEEDVPAEEVESDKEESEEEADDEISEPLEGEFYFGDKAVKIEVPDEISSALEEAGIDQKELLSQLFKKDGDFSIDDETRSKLEEKFGATMVNGYLNMYKTMNEQNVAKFESEAKSQAEAEKAEGEAYAAAVGGEEGLIAMEGYITDNFNEDQISAYNSVMENGDTQSQLLIISQVKSMMEMQDKLTNGDKSVSLVGDKDASNSGVSTPLDKGYLSGSEYEAIMQGDEYWTNSAYAAKVDAARMAGFKHDA